MSERVERSRHRDERKIRRSFRFRPAYLLVVAIMGLFGYAFLHKTQEIHRLAAQESALAARNNAIQADNDRTRSAIKYYRTSQYTIDEARSELGYTLPGETAVVSQPVHANVPVYRPAPKRLLVPPPPTWEQWFHSFFG